MNYRTQEDITTALSAIVVLFVVVFIIATCVAKPYASASSVETIIITPLSTEAKIKFGEKEQTYLISARLPDGTMEVFESTDTLMYGKYNSADIYFELKNNIGAQYRAKVVGWRVPYLSWNRNIVELEKVQE